MEGLRPICQGCHSSGTRGFFASASAFQNLLVLDPRLVAPGDPDHSELVRLLEGRGTGAYTQMPAVGLSYIARVAAGQATLTMEQIRAWVLALKPAERDPTPDPDAPRIARIGAVQIKRALYQQLGLSDDDFFQSGDNFGISMATANDDQTYPLKGADELPAPFQRAPADRHLAIGGGAIADQARPQPAIFPSFLHTLTQVAQRWCRLALAKPSNSALLPDGATLSADPGAARALLTRWHRHFLAERPTAEEVDAVYTEVFAPLAASAGIEPAYVGTCSFFIRHPRWIFY
jgi:hypothetical protein